MAKSGSLGLTAASGTSVPIDIDVLGDLRGEPDERFALKVTGAPDFVAVEDDGIVTIRTDDTPPVNTGAPTIAGDLYDGRTLTVDPGTWSGKGTIQLTSQWERCDATGACSAISGATGDTYMIADADVGAALRVAVTATNETGFTVARSAISSIIAPTPARGQVEKTAAVQALINGSLFNGDCAWRCQQIGAREAQSTDPEARSQMAELRFALGLFGGGGSSPTAVASTARAASRRPLARAASTTDGQGLVAVLSPYLGGIRRQNQLPYAVIKVKSGTSLYSWRWRVPPGSFQIPADLGPGTDPTQWPIDVDWMIWHQEGQESPNGYHFPQTAWYGAYRADEYRWPLNTSDDPPLCTGSYSAPTGKCDRIQHVRLVGSGAARNIPPTPAARATTAR